MGDTLYVVGERMNAVRCAYAPISPTGDPLYPFTNLVTGQPGEPGSFATLGGVHIDGDLNEIPNGGMEDAFAGELPTSSWTKIASGVITRDTSIKLAGAASLKLNPAAIQDGLYIDLKVRPGEAWNFSGAVYSSGTGTTGAVVVRNLATGSYLVGADGSWSASIAALVSNPTAAWVPRTVATTIESWADCGNVPLVTIRIYIAAYTDAGDDLYFDEICAWRTPSFVSIHGHNIPSHCGPVELCLGAAASPTTLAATLGHCEGSMYALIDPEFKPRGSRYWRLRVTNAPLEEPIWIDKLVLGQYEALRRRQKWEQSQALDQAQDRSDNDVGPQQSYLRSKTQRAQWTLSFLDLVEEDYAQRRRLMLDSANGAHPTVFVIDTDTDVALAGRQVFLVRMDKTFKHGRRPTTLRDSSATLEELPIFAGMMG